MDPTRLSIGLVPGSTEPGGQWSEDAVHPSRRTLEGTGRVQWRIPLPRCPRRLLPGSPAKPFPCEPTPPPRSSIRDGHIGHHQFGLSMRCRLEHHRRAPEPECCSSRTASSRPPPPTMTHTSGATPLAPRPSWPDPGSGSREAAPWSTSRVRASAFGRWPKHFNECWCGAGYDSRHQHRSGFTFNLFQPVPLKLYPQMQRPAPRYLGPTSESRDFFTVTIRAVPDAALDPTQLINSYGLWGIFAIIFAESGLFFGFFLPGDSLLVTAGLLASTHKTGDIHSTLPPCWIGCTIAAIAGDQSATPSGVASGPSCSPVRDRNISSPITFTKHAATSIDAGRR